MLKNLFFLLNDREELIPEFLTKSQYDALSSSTRRRRLYLTLDYIRRLSRQENAFKNNKGEDVLSISVEELNNFLNSSHIKNLRTPPSESPLQEEKWVIENRTRIPTDVVIHWISALQNKLDQLTALSPAEAAATPLFNMQKSVLESLIGQRKTLWQSHNLRIGAVKDVLQQDSALLRQAELGELADLAYRADDGVSLLKQLPIDENFSENQTALRHNLYGRVFETTLIHELIENPAQKVLATMGQVAQGLKAMVYELPNHGLYCMSILHDKIRADSADFRKNGQAHWHQKTPAINDFLNASDNTAKLAVLNSILSKPIENGYEAILISYLTQKIYLSLGTKPEWIKTTDAIYDEMTQHKVKGYANEFMHVLPPDSIVSRNRSTLAVPPGSRPSTPQTRPSTPQTRPSTPSNYPVAVTDLLTYGIPLVNGVSGTTNLFLGTLAHLKTDLGYNIDVQDALLGLLMYLVEDGGHSIHEALWTVNFREKLAQESSQFSGKKYIALNFPDMAAQRKSVRDTFIADYGKLFSSYKDIRTKTIIESAHHIAWEKTIEYFKKNSVYRNMLEKFDNLPHPTTSEQKLNRLEQLLAPYNIANIDENIARVINQFIEEVAESHMIDRSEAIKKLSSFLERYDISHSFIDGINPLIRLSLEAIKQKEMQAESLLYTMHNHREFVQVSMDNLWRLVVDQNQQTLQTQYDAEIEIGYYEGMFAAYEQMLNNKFNGLTENHFFELHKTAVQYVWQKHNHTFVFREGYPSLPLLETEYNDTSWEKPESRYNLILKLPGDADTKTYNATLDGFNELQKKATEDKYFEVKKFTLNAQKQLVADKNGKVAEIVIANKSTSDIKAHVRKIISAYHKEIAKANNDTEKFTAIARLGRDLAAARPFKDGNTRTISIVINKLLLQNDFTPTILDSNNHLEGFSVAEVVAQIKKGQTNFSMHMENSGSNNAISTNSPKEYSTEHELSYFSEVREKYTLLETKLFDSNNRDFEAGYDLNQYRDIVIPGYDPAMTLIEMKSLALSLDSQFNMRARGALIRRIVMAQANSVNLSQLGKSLHNVRNAFVDLDANNSPYKHTMLQSHYLIGADSNLIGICYGLTHAMATALATGGEQGANHFVNKLNAATEHPNAQAAQLLHLGLKKLHGDANAHYQLRGGSQATALNRLTLNQIGTRLEAATTPVMYEFNLSKHSMLLGSLLVRGQKRYYFYDPNIGIVSYSSVTALKSALTKYFSAQRLKDYGLFSDQQSTIDTVAFEFETIDTARLSTQDIPGEGLGYLTINDFFADQSLTTTLAQKKTEDLSRNMVSHNQLAHETTTNPAILATSTNLESKHLATNLLTAADSLYKTENLSTDYIPLLAKIEETATGYRIPFINRRNTSEAIRWINTDNQIWTKTQKYMDNHIQKFEQNYSLDETFAIRKKSHAPENGVNSLNAGFAVQQLITWVQQGHREANISQDTPSNLATALNIHSYVSMSQIAQGTVHDAQEITSIVQTLLNADNSAALATSTFTSTLGHIGQGLGIGLNAASAILDLYEFTHAENETQKAVFATQLTFDTAGLLMSTAGIGAGLLGASTVAGVLGPLSVVVAGVGVGASGLAEAYGEVADDEKKVRDYFAALRTAYETSYEYTSSDDLLHFLPGGVITELNFKKAKITHDSQYLYASDYGASGYNNSPNDNSNRAQAINIREAFKQPAQRTMNNNAKNASIVILPSTAKSYIHHYSQLLLSARKVVEDSSHEALRKEDKGYDSLYLIEENSNGRFKVDQAALPFKSLVRSISHDYSLIILPIILDTRERTLVVPYTPPRQDAKIGYSFHGDDGTYTIVAQERAVLEISTKTGEKSHWILDGRSLDTDKLEFFDQGIILSNVQIFLSSQNEAITVLKKNGDVYKVNYKRKTMTVDVVDVEQWKKNHPESIQAHLQSLAQHHELSGQYIPADNYSENGELIARAYYDTKGERMLFSKPNGPIKELVSAIKRVADSSFNVHWTRIAAGSENWKKVIVLDTADDWEKLLDIFRKINSQKAVSAITNLITNIEALLTFHNKKLADAATPPETADAFQNKNLVIIPLANEAGNAQIDAVIAKLTPLIQQVDTQLSTVSKNIDDTLTPVFKNAQLLGVIGQSAYFYNKKQDMVWRTNCATNLIQTQFESPFKGQIKRFWIQGDALYMSCQGWIDTPTEKAEYIYRISENKMSLVTVNIADAGQTGKGISDGVVDWLGNNTHIGVPIKSWLALYAAIQAPTLVLASITATRYDSIIAIAGKDSQGVQQHYWLKHMTIIKANLPLASRTTSSTSTSLTSTSTNMPSDLFLAAIMPAQNNTPAILYFYSYTNKVLYRQEGYGTSATGQAPAKVATRLDIPNLIDILRTENDLFVITEAGLVQQVDRNGNLNLMAVNETWLKQQGNNWRTALQAISKKQTTLSIIGIKNAATDNSSLIHAWYHDTKLIISTLPSATLQFLDFDHQQQHARLFDSTSGKLYTQKISDETKLSAAFGTDYILDVATHIDPASEILPGYCFKSATVLGDNLRLQTNQGIILNLNSDGLIQLIGVTQQWQKNHPGNTLASALETLINSSPSTWIQGEALFLQGNTALTWYHIKAKKIIAATGLEVADKPELIGLDPDYQEAYIYSARQGVYQYHCGDDQALIPPRLRPEYGFVKRLSNTLTLTGTENNDGLEVLTIDKANMLLMSGEGGSDSYQITRGNRQHYQNIRINNFDKNQAMDRLNVAVEAEEKIIMSSSGNDLLLSDKHGSLCFEKVLSTERDSYTHLEITFITTKGSFQRSLAELANSYEQLIQAIAATPGATAQTTVTLVQTPSNSAQLSPSVI